MKRRYLIQATAIIGEEITCVEASTHRAAAKIFLKENPYANRGDKIMVWGDPVEFYVTHGVTDMLPDEDE